jgi:hypothetical protein
LSKIWHRLPDLDHSKMAVLNSLTSPSSRPGRGDLAHTAKEPDLNRIHKHISPKWGTCLLREIKPYPVQDWLRKLPLAPKDQRPSSGSHVPPLRESYALAIDSLRTQLHGLSRTQRSQQATQASSHFDRGGIWSAAQSARPSLPLYGSFGGVHRPSCQRGDGRALGPDRLRKADHGSQGGICSRPSHETEIGMFPGRTASGSGCRNHSSGVETSLPRNARRLGLSQPTNQQTVRFWLAPQESAQGCGEAGQDSGASRIHCVTATALGSTRLVRRSVFNRNSCVTPISQPR